MKKNNGLIKNIFTAALILITSNISYSADEIKGTTTTEIEKPSVLKNIVASVKSYNGTSRGVGNEDSLYKGKHELNLGYKFNSNWSSYATVSQSVKVYKIENHEDWANGDSSLTVTHPNWYKGDTNTISGYIRGYFPNSTRSYQRDIRQYAYYLNHISPSFLNFLTARKFNYNKEKATDTSMAFEYRTVYLLTNSSPLSFSINQVTNYETHVGTDSGLAVEVYPGMEYKFSKNFLTRFSYVFPILAQNAVYEGPKSATLDQSKFEFYLEMKL